MDNKNNSVVFNVGNKQEDKIIKKSITELKNDLENLNKNFGDYLLSCWKDIDDKSNGIEGLYEEQKYSDKITDFFNNFDKKYINPEKEQHQYTKSDIIIDYPTVQFIQEEVRNDVNDLKEGIERLKNFLQTKVKEIPEISG